MLALATGCFYWRISAASAGTDREPILMIGFPFRPASGTTCNDRWPTSPGGAQAKFLAEVGPES